jgi:hypothetical protein
MKARKPIAMRVRWPLVSSAFWTGKKRGKGRKIRRKRLKGA